MSHDKLRRQIVFEAARLIYSHQESEYYRAKLKAARKICGGWAPLSQLPSNSEIRDEVQRFAWLYEGESRLNNLRDMRIAALRMMRRLSSFKPRLIGSVLTGHVREGSDIDLHLFANTAEAIASVLEEVGITYGIEHKRVRRDGQERIFTHIHARERFDFELTIYAPELTSFVFRSSITGQPIEKANIEQLEQLLRCEYPDLELDGALAAAEQQLDRFEVFRHLLVPLEKVHQGRTHHPEGDALYHSLQVYDLAIDEVPYDQDFLLAALLHDVGKGIDQGDHVAAGLEALQGFITERTHWLIEHHMHAHQLLDRTLGARAERRLRSHPDFDLLLALCHCDRDGRQCSVKVPELDEVLEYLRDLE